MCLSYFAREPGGENRRHGRLQTIRRRQTRSETDLRYDRSVIDIDYATLEADLESGAIRMKLTEQLTVGFRLMLDAGDAVPPASHYASRITEIIYSAADSEISKETAYYLYQEVLLACEEARAAVLGNVS